MGAGTATIAFDVDFTREVLGDFGRYFTRPQELAELCDRAEADVGATARRGRAQIASLGRYEWDGVAENYEQLAFRRSGRRMRSGRPAAGAGRR
jgi:glycosyltransferase involved in cell wall biosynthesis